MRKTKNLNKSNFNFKLIVKATKNYFYSQINTTINLKNPLRPTSDFLLLIILLIFILQIMDSSSNLNVENIEFFLHLITLFFSK